MTEAPENAGAIGFLTTPGLLRDLTVRKATGQLVVRQGEIIKKIYFRSGFILSATSNLTADRLGDVLLARGTITRDQFDDSARQVLATGRKQGTILVRVGALGPKDLFHGLIAQVREIVVSTCAWDGGDWSFIEGPPPQEEIVSLRLHPAGLIFEGLALTAADPRWNGVWNPRPLELLPAADAPVALEKIDAPAAARRLFSLVGQGRSLQELARLIGSDDRDTAVMLYGLALLGLVEARPQPAAKPAAVMQEPATAAPQVPRDDEAARSPRRKVTSQVRASQADATLPDPAAARSAAPSEDSQLAREQFTTGLALLNSGDVWSAIQALRWATNLAPMNPRYHTWLGVALMRTKKRLHEAEEHCKTAITLDNGNAQFHVHLGQVYRTGHLFDKAKQQFETALQLDPKNLGALKEIREMEPPPGTDLPGHFSEK